MPILTNKQLNQTPKSILLLYGTHTGNSERLANLTVKKMTNAGIEIQVSDMCLFKGPDLKNIDVLLMIISTHGMGEPPIRASSLYNFLHSNEAPELPQLQYTVLALGDNAYKQFCQAGIDFDNALAKLGAQRMYERVDCDFDFEDDYMRWIEGVLSILSQQ
jgi:sulfite reductase (NADPH) flavoprotein alpha-component